MADPLLDTVTELPFPAPDDPLPLVRQWLDEAFTGPARNPGAMALATSGTDGRPAVRMVLLKEFAPAGYAVFYTNYESRKGLELCANTRAAAVLYWEWLGRQLRLEGPVLRSPQTESDAYFATRPLASQANAWASEQSRPLVDPAALRLRAERRTATLLADEKLPRPAYWGGFRIWVEALELWAEGAGRFHDRVRYTRNLRPAGSAEFTAGAWRHQRLQP